MFYNLNYRKVNCWVISQRKVIVKGKVFPLKSIIHIPRKVIRLLDSSLCKIFSTFPSLFSQRNKFQNSSCCCENTLKLLEGDWNESYVVELEKKFLLLNALERKAISRAERKKSFRNYIFHSIRKCFTIFFSPSTKPMALHYHVFPWCIQALSIVIYNAWNQEKTFVQFIPKLIFW